MAIRFRDPDTDPDPYRDTGETCLGGGMHCPSAPSFTLNFLAPNFDIADMFVYTVVSFSKRLHDIYRLTLAHH